MDVAFVNGLALRRRSGPLDALGHGYLEAPAPVTRLLGRRDRTLSPGLLSWAMQEPLGVTIRTGESFTLNRAAGTTLRCEEGRLWITEEGVAEDVALVAGQSTRLLRNGKALVLALRDARLTLDGAAKAAA
jgi:hypothetical protein